MPLSPSPAAAPQAGAPASIFPTTLPCMVAAETDDSPDADSSAPAASTITVAATRTPDAFAFGAQFAGPDPVDPGW